MVIVSEAFPFPLILRTGISGGQYDPAAGAVFEERQLRAKLPTEEQHAFCWDEGVQIFRPVSEAI